MTWSRGFTHCLGSNWYLLVPSQPLGSFQVCDCVSMSRRLSDKWRKVTDQVFINTYSLSVTDPGSPELPPSEFFPFQAVTGPSRLQWSRDADTLLIPVLFTRQKFKEFRSQGELSKGAEDLSSVDPHSRTLLKPAP